MYDVPTGLTNRKRGIPNYNDGAVVIHTGLSIVTACGHKVDLVRDASTKTATVRVQKIPHVVPGSDECNLVEATDILAERARRFLGAGWTIVKWTPRNTALEQPTTGPHKVAGFKSESQHL